MGIKVGINGFGRIGRNIMRAAMGTGKLDFVAVNDLTDTATLAHLLKYDSILGNLDATVESGDGWISVNGDKFQVLAQKDPGQLPWRDLGVEVVFEGTGRFTPNIEGPNPQRSQSRNNVGDVYVVAKVLGDAADGKPAPTLRARAHLLVTVPLYMRFEPMGGR